MIRPDLGGCYVAVISSKRPANVAPMTELLGQATWFVGAGEALAYGNAVEGGGLCASRNKALRAAWERGAPCLQFSDDLRKVERAVSVGPKLKALPSTLGQEVARLLTGMKVAGAKLGGFAPTSNPFYANVDRPLHTGAFIVGDAILVQPCDLLFDEQLRLKEDYDYTLQHLQQFGVVARLDDALLTFLHRGNAGGAVAVRTSALEQESIDHLRRKWPAYIRDNPRRKDEILLRLPRSPRLALP